MRLNSGVTRAVQLAVHLRLRWVGLLAAATLLSCLCLTGCGRAASAPPFRLTPGPTPPARPGATVVGVGLPPDLMLVSGDGGASWAARRKGTSDDPSSWLWDVAFGDRRDAWAVERGANRQEGVVLVSRDAGLTWSAERTGFKGRLLKVAASDARHVWVLADTGSGAPRASSLLLASSDGGRTWQKQHIPGQVSISDVAFSDARHGWAVTRYMDDPGSAVFSTADGGRHWRLRYSTSAASLSRLATINAGHCWCRTDRTPSSPSADRSAHGRRRTLVQGPSRTGPAGFQDRHEFINNEHGCGDLGGETSLPPWMAAGAAWSRQDVGDDYRLADVTFSDREHGWAMIGHVGLLATENGGRTWTVVMPLGSVDDGFMAISSPSRSDRTRCGGRFSIRTAPEATAPPSEPATPRGRPRRPVAREPHALVLQRSETRRAAYT